MKRLLTLITAVLLMAVSTQALAEAYDLPLAPEQILPGGIVKPDSLTEPPTIIFLSNATAFNSSDISLPVKVKVGDSITAQSKQIELIYYKGDWQNSSTELYRYLPQFMNGSRLRMSSIQEYTASINLTAIPEGNHTLTVHAGEIGGYIRNQNNYCYAYTFIINATSTFEFFIGTNETSEPQSTTPAPPVPELTSLIAVPLLLSIFAVAVLVKHRKTRNH